METIFSSQTMQLLLVFLACYNLAEALPFLSGEDARKMLDTSIGRTSTNQLLNRLKTTSETAIEKYNLFDYLLDNWDPVND